MMRLEHLCPPRLAARAALLLLTAGSVCGQPLFEDVTDEAFPLDRFPTGPSIAARSVAFGDYDNDGWPDLAVGQNSGPRLGLWRNDGGRVFADVTSTALPAEVQGPAKGGGTVFGDYDNDGDLDLFVAHGSWVDATAVSMLLRNDRGTFTDVSAAAGLDRILGTDNAIWLDYDRDGFLDLYTGNVDCNSEEETVRNRLYRNRGDGTFADATATAGLDVTFGSNCGGGSNGGLAAADFDDDGWPDLYVAVFGGPNRLFFNDQGHFVEVTTPEIADEGQAYGAAVIDVNGDGRLDIFQAGGGDETGPAWRSRLLINLGGRQFTDILESAGLGVMNDESTLGVGAADVDNDGDVDLFSVEPLHLFVNDGDLGFAEASSFGISNTFQGVSFADVDRDGRIDLAIDNQRQYTGQGFGGLFLNRGDAGHWLRVEVVGTASNRSGIGAHLTLTTGEQRQVREVLGGLGYQQNEPVAHFGLGDQTRADLEIRWPSGQVDVLRDIPADQQIRVLEGSGRWHRSQPFPPVEVRPSLLLAGMDQPLQLRVHPTLFEPQARVARVVADLRELGGAQQTPFRDAGDGSWVLDTVLPAGPNGVHQVDLWVDQATAVGDRWTKQSVRLRIVPAHDARIAHDGVSSGWRLGPPDTGGPKLGFVADRDGVTTLELIGSDGTNRARLVRAAGNLVDDAGFALWQPSWDWSPDGSRIVVSGNLDGVRTLWVAAADGTELRKLTDPPAGFVDAFPAWSPDGSRIAFVSGSASLEEGQIYVTDVEAGGRTQLTEAPFGAIHPAWSPDGTRIAFTVNSDPALEEGLAHVHVMDADGGNPVQLTHTQGRNGSPSWSPDGSRLAYKNYLGALMTMRPDGGDTASVAALAAWSYSPSWSPDGTRIAAQLNRNLVTFRPDGSDLVQLTDTPHGEFIPCWLPAGAPPPLQVLNAGLETTTYEQRAARRLRAERLWLASYVAAEPLEPTGYTALAFGFHPGDAVLKEVGWLEVRVNDSYVNLLDYADVGARRWQEVEIPMAAFRLGGPIERIELSGVLLGEFYLSDIRLVAAASEPLTAVAEEQSTVPGAFALSQNHPNPFNPETVIDFDLPRAGPVELSVYDLLGQRVATLIRGHREAGSHSLRWDGRDGAGRPLASGIYIYRLTAGDDRRSRKLLLLR